MPTEIKRMNILTPFLVRSSNSDGDLAERIVYVDILEEKVYLSNGDLGEGDVCDEVKKIILEKKGKKITGRMDEVVFDVLDKKKELMKGIDARTTRL